MLKWFFSWNSFSCHVCFKTSKWLGGWDVWSQVVKCCRGSLLPNYGTANAFASCFALVCFMQGGKWKEMANDCRCTSFLKNCSWIGRLHCQSSIWITTIISFNLKVHKAHVHALKSSKIESWSHSKAWGGIVRQHLACRKSVLRAGGQRHQDILIHIPSISCGIAQGVGIGRMRLRDFGGELPWYWWYWLFFFVLLCRPCEFESWMRFLLDAHVKTTVKSSVHQDGWIATSRARRNEGQRNLQLTLKPRRELNPFWV